MTRPNHDLSLSLSLSLALLGQVGENPGNEVGFVVNFLHIMNISGNDISF